MGYRYDTEWCLVISPLNIVVKWSDALWYIKAVFVPFREWWGFQSFEEGEGHGFRKVCLSPGWGITTLCLNSWPHLWELGYAVLGPICLGYMPKADHIVGVLSLVFYKYDRSQYYSHAM